MNKTKRDLSQRIERLIDDINDVKIKMPKDIKDRLSENIKTLKRVKEKFDKK